MNLPAYPYRKYMAGRMAVSIVTKSHEERHSRAYPDKKPRRTG